MNWSDEKYVKLYTRDTLTWLSLSWEARALLALLLRKVDGAGLMEVGNLEAAHAVALQLVMPTDVVRRALAELVAIGTVTEVRGGILIANFVEAQESTKTEARKKKDQRQRVADQRRLAQVVESVEAHVPQCPAVSRDVPDCPPPAQPTTSPPPPPAQPTTSPRARAKRKGQQGTLVGVPAPTPEPRKQTPAEILHAAFVDLREGKCLSLGLRPVPPDDPPNWARSAATVSAWLKLHPGDTPEDALIFAELLIGAYVEDPYWAGATHPETKAPQPYPWNALMSEKVWRRLAERLDRELDGETQRAVGGVH